MSNKLYLQETVDEDFSFWINAAVQNLAPENSHTVRNNIDINNTDILQANLTC